MRDEPMDEMAEADSVDADGQHSTPNNEAIHVANQELATGNRQLANRRPVTGNRVLLQEPIGPLNQKYISCVLIIKRILP